MKEIEARIHELQEQIKPLAEELAGLQQKRRELLSDFKVGDIISWDNKRGRVIAVCHWIGSSPRWQVQRLKKDGTEGCQVAVYPFHNPVLETSK